MVHFFDLLALGYLGQSILSGLTQGHDDNNNKNKDEHLEFFSKNES